MRGVVLLAWWFMTVSSNGFAGTVATHGPFQTEAQCEQMRTWVHGHAQGAKYIAESWCWWDGR